MTSPNPDQLRQLAQADLLLLLGQWLGTPTAAPYDNDDLLQLASSPYLPPTDREDEQVERLRRVGMAHFELGSGEKLSAVSGELRAMLARLSDERKEAEATARAKAEEENESPEKIDEAVKDAGKRVGRRVEAVGRALDELDTYAALLAGGDTSGDALENVKRSKHALARIELAYGDPAEAERLAREAVSDSENSVVPLAVTRVPSTT